MLLIDSCLFQRLVTQRVTKMAWKRKSIKTTSKSEICCFCILSNNKLFRLCHKIVGQKLIYRKLRIYFSFFSKKYCNIIRLACATLIFTPDSQFAMTTQTYVPHWIHALHANVRSLRSQKMYATADGSKVRRVLVFNCMAVATIY